MRTKVTLVLIFLNVALFYFIFFVGGDFKPAKDVSGILGPEVANIQTLTIRDVAGETLIQLERRTDKWLITQPITWPANEFSVRSIINELQFLRPNATFLVADLPKSGQTLADFGLEKPPLSLAFTPAAVPGSTPVTVLLRIGNSTGVGNNLYVLSPDGERIHVVPRSLAESLARTLVTLRSDELFTIPVFEASSLNLEPANGSRIRFRRENDRWLIEGLSVNQTRASKVNTELALGSLRELRVASFVPETEDAAVRAALANPMLRITIQGTNRRETLLLGPPAPAPAAQETATPDETAGPPKPVVPSTLYYAMMETDDSSESPGTRATLFTVSVPDAFLKTTLLNAQRELREKQILDVDPTSLSAITLSTSQRPNDEVVLQRLEAPAASAWQIVRRTPERAPQPEPADRAIVDRLISDLTRLSAQEPAQNEEAASAFIDAPSEAQKEEFGFNRPARTLTLTTNATAGPAPAPVRLLIGVGQDRRTYAKLGHQETIYRVSDEILANTPTDPLYYRQRLIRELPTSTAITSLKLTDLSNDSVLLDTPLPVPADAPATTPPAVIETLVAQLRVLRAKSFTATEFTKTVFVAGEERPWKFRLDATLAPAGGNAGANPAVSSLFFSDRAGGDRLLAGSPEFNLVFEVEQPLLDALFALTYGPRDPGPSAPPPKPPAATPAPQ